MKEEKSNEGEFMSPLDSAEILEAYRRLSTHVYRTPLVLNRELSTLIHGEVYLKLESEQKTGSFKIRGATNKLLSLSPDEKKAGVVTASAGNHALGVAYAAEHLKIPATIFLPRTAARNKVKALRNFPITLRLVGTVYEEAERAALSKSRKNGAVYVSPYNDPMVMAGGGTVAHEIIEELPDPDTVIVPVGGGGLISGIGSYLKALKPSIDLIGVQSVASPTMSSSLKAGKIITVHVRRSLADGLAGNLDPQTRTFSICQEVVNDILLVTESQIRSAIRWSLLKNRKVIEGSAAVGIAALMKNPKRFLRQRVIIVVTGSNVDLKRVL